MRRGRAYAKISTNFDGEVRSDDWTILDLASGRVASGVLSFWVPTSALAQPVDIFFEEST